MSSRIDSPQLQECQVRRGAKALITTGDRLLLVKETHSDGAEFWTLPGGGARPNEPLTTALERELLEELFCRVSVHGECASFWYAHSSSDRDLSWYTVFDCTLASPPVPNGAEDVLDRRWVHPDELPSGTLLGVRAVVENLADGEDATLPPVEGNTPLPSEGRSPSLAGSFASR